MGDLLGSLRGLGPQPAGRRDPPVRRPPDRRSSSRPRSLSATALSGTTLRLSGWWRGFLLERRRRREQAQKEKQRRDVVKKHLERAKEDAAGPRPRRQSEPEADVVYIPSVATLRVKEKAGAGTVLDPEGGRRRR